MASPADPRDPDHARLRAVAFDLDGTLCMGDAVVPGAAAVVEHVRRSGLWPLFLTNSTIRNTEQLVERLASFGIAAAAGEIYSSAVAAARYVAERGHRTAYVVGSPVIRAEVAGHGVRLAERPEEAEALVVGFVPEFDPASLPHGFPGDCEFVAANLDADFPVENGVRLPGCGQTVARVAERLGRGHDAVAGKPGTFMLDCVEADLGLVPDEIVVVGDNVTSDVAMANAAGCRSILIVPAGRRAGEVGEAGAAIGRLTDLPDVLDRMSL